MSLRRRVTLISAAAVTVAVLVASVVSYLLVARRLHTGVDNSLRSEALARGIFNGRALGGPAPGPGRGPAVTRFLQSNHLRVTDSHGKPLTSAKLAALLAARPAGGLGSEAQRFFANPAARPGEVTPYRQLVGSGGQVIGDNSSPSLRLPVTPAVVSLTKARSPAQILFDAHVKGIHLRVLAETAPESSALEIARPLSDTDSTLSNLRLILAGIDIGSILIAALLGRLIAGAALLPVKRLTRAAEHVTHTQDLSQRIEPTGSDELGRLAHSFNGMLDALAKSMNALDDSVQAQRQLVADASHELRTPVTSLRANIEIVQAVPDMDPEERGRMLSDAVDQAEELTLLMNDLIELARGDQRNVEHEVVRLDELVAAVIERHRRHAPGVTFEVELAPCLVDAVPARLDRAVSNLVDNAVKWSPPGGPVEIALDEGVLTVRDHGPGIAEADRAHVFDRFYRGAEARGRPGSGLGLAIVRQAATSHGGTVEARPAADGGTLMSLHLPSVRAAEPQDPAPSALR
jgi:two-component system sensor histidine kinase MprB